MSEFILVPRGGAVAFIDGTFSSVKDRGGYGIVLITPGRVRLLGLPIDPLPMGKVNSHVAESLAAARACTVALADPSAPVRLRVVGDCSGIIDAIEGRTHGREPVQEAFSAARAQGLELSGRWIRAHMETMDLPTRLNGIAHWLSHIGRDGTLMDRTLPLEEGWLTALETEPQFRPERTSVRDPVPIEDAALFLGIGLPEAMTMAKAKRLRRVADKGAVRWLAGPRHAKRLMKRDLIEWDSVAREYEAMMHERLPELFGTWPEPVHDMVPAMCFG